MPLSAIGGLPQRRWRYAEAAAAIPGALLGQRKFAEAGTALEFLAASAQQAGVLPVSEDDPSPDPIGSLWFIRAAHLFGEAGGDRGLTERLLMQSKGILQDFIAHGGLGGVKMDDGGLLMVAPEQSPAEGLRLNALWYSALESTAVGLKKAGDVAGDHFERLAGRFRRAFIKAYWCEGHHCVCPPYRRMPESHGEILDVEQLLMTVLPASPIPRTKQRKLLQFLRVKLTAGSENGAVGLPLDHPTLGRVESLMHRAWLGVGLLNSAENRNTGRAEAAAVLAPLEPLLAGAGPSGLVGYYRGGKAVENLMGDPLTTAEVMGALALVKG